MAGLSGRVSGERRPNARLGKAAIGTLLSPCGPAQRCGTQIACPTLCRMSTFTFQPRWKEELVCTGAGGSFVLELPMGRLTACLPTETAWKDKAPAWAHDLWPVLKVELEAWCRSNRAQFVLDHKAGVYPIDTP